MITTRLRGSLTTVAGSIGIAAGGALAASLPVTQVHATSVPSPCPVSSVAAVTAGGVAKSIDTSSGCNGSAGSAFDPATGWIGIRMPAGVTGASAADAVQAIPAVSPQLFYDGVYTVAFDSCQGGSATGGSYTVTTLLGTSSYPGTPPVMVPAVPITVTASSAGGLVACHYTLTVVGTPPLVSGPHGVTEPATDLKNEIWVHFANGSAAHVASQSVKAFPEIPPTTTSSSTDTASSSSGSSSSGSSSSSSSGSNSSGSNSSGSSSSSSSNNTTSSTGTNSSASTGSSSSSSDTASSSSSSSNDTTSSTGTGTSTSSGSSSSSSDTASTSSSGSNSSSSSSGSSSSSSSGSNNSSSSSGSNNSSSSSSSNGSNSSSSSTGTDTSTTSNATSSTGGASTSSTGTGSSSSAGGAATSTSGGAAGGDAISDGVQGVKDAGVAVSSTQATPKVAAATAATPDAGAGLRLRAALLLLVAGGVLLALGLRGSARPVS